ncbi:enoyl-[acyl-carrier protein] reductase II [Salibacterium salarium]|uniref:NAD(P)H-dependent flavin oxidoreductase n=1 Tax=Salibacterium salarium TaxID=284579 RepID=UPI00277D7BBD|nr:nitronate monooxygenase family protein [Salibacterium salarium]MDQ0298975.1 enoyl-[acyl-carrier protein] reductase II [Salibacterium salarium]
MKWKTAVNELLEIDYPIIQGGLAYLAYSDLAAAVSNAGGLGQITAMSLRDEEALKDEIKKVKTKTDNPFGVNFAISKHGSPYHHMVEAALEENVKIISMTGSNPSPIFEMLKGTDVKTLVLVASRRQAQKAEELGADLVMVVGQEGGGHIGRDDTGTMVLLPQVVDSVSIPVIASGGIGDGRAMMAALALGAEGIEMGTRFIATKDCIHAHPMYKEALMRGTENDTVLIKRSIGTPGRVLKNEWTEKILDIENETPDYESLKNFINGKANCAYIHEGNETKGFGWAGQVIGRINDCPSVSELFERIIYEADQVRNSWMK